KKSRRKAVPGSGGSTAGSGGTPSQEAGARRTRPSTGKASAGKASAGKSPRRRQAEVATPAGRAGGRRKASPAGTAAVKAASRKKTSDDVPRPLIEEAVATRLLRDSYTRERHYFLMRLILAAFAALVISIAANVYLATRPVEHRYFATDTEGRIKTLTA